MPAVLILHCLELCYLSYPVYYIDNLRETVVPLDRCTVAINTGVFTGSVTVVVAGWADVMTRPEASVISTELIVDLALMVSVRALRLKVS